ncbi:MAG: RNA methyltransferase [Kiritimatiellaceae bacterium]|nr:RNA methyltransferase [Kiritimatiellaceae bacterium]
MQTITSKDNPKLKAVRALVRSKKDRQEASAFVMEGVRSLSALSDGSALPQYRLREIWVASDAVELAKDFAVPVYAVEPAVMEQLSDCQTSQGILGVVQYTQEPLTILPEKGNYLLVDGLTDPGNLGTLIRSAVAFGFSGVFLHGDTVEVFNPKTVRATMGALPFANVWKTDETVFQTLEQSGYDLISTVIHGGENLHTMKLGPKNVLVIGNEAHGVSAAVQQRATRSLSIPMSGNVESLNAAVAGSICMVAISG